MIKGIRKIWVWILSGLGFILGGCGLINRDVPCLYGPPKVYGPPPPENHVDLESETDTVGVLDFSPQEDSTTNTINEIEEE